MQRPPEPGTPVAVPYVLADGEGEVIRWFGDTITVKSAGPTLDVSMVTAVAGSELPLHVHGEVDEALFVLEGSLTVVAGSERLAASAGAFIFLPARVPHALVVESGSATLLVIAVPSGSLTMYGEIEERFGPREMPARLRDTDLAVVTPALEAHGITVIEPHGATCAVGADGHRGGSRTQKAHQKMKGER